jgi:dipeptidyl aminopeptidase/acylaminoacyl peptidase
VIHQGRSLRIVIYRIGGDVMRMKRFARRDRLGSVRATLARRAVLVSVLAAAAFGSWLPSAAQAGFRPGAIAYDEYSGPQDQLVSSGGGAPLLMGGGAAGFPVWSPNGETLAFSAGWTILLADRGLRVFDTIFTAAPLSSLGCCSAVGSLDWSPDGRQIAYSCANPNGVAFPGGDTPPNVCVVDVTTGAHRVLAASISQFWLVGAVSWSPVGDVIATDLGVCAPDTSLYSEPPAGACAAGDHIGLVHVASGAVTVLGPGSSPDFSPDGSQIVYDEKFATAGSPAGVDIMSASGRFIRQVVPAAHAVPGVGGVSPTWSPDGKEILFSTRTDGATNGNSDLFSVSVHGGRLTQVTHDPNDDSHASWAPLVTTCTVPKLKGQTLATAKTLVYLAGCVVGKVTGPKTNRSTRHVVNQKPSANRNVATGTKVNIQIR